jgi:UPF0271 protein
MATAVDLNSDLGESYGPWSMGDDAAMLRLVTSANIACGGHASDPDTMVATLAEAKANGVVIGAHPGYADRIAFGRRVLPMTPAEVERMVATQIGALMGAAALAGARVAYVKAHGALSNVASDDRAMADAIARATRAISPDLALLAISGTELEAAGRAANLDVYSEVFADRAYLPNGRLVPRSREGAMIHDPLEAGRRLVEVLDSGRMPTIDGGEVSLAAHSICVHGDSPGAVEMARQVRATLEGAGVAIAPFLARA